MITTWIILFLAFIFIEIITVNLVTIWFAIGAFAAALSCIFLTNDLISLIIFTVISIISLLVTKPLIKKIKINDKIPTNFDRVIGKTAIVTQEIKKLEPGEVKVDGKYWSAIANKKILKDSKVEILSIDGVKLKVQEIKEDE